MKNNKVMPLFVLVMLLASIEGVHATTVFVIEPSKEATCDVECPKTCISFAGNVSAFGGPIDFYVTNPLGQTVVSYQNKSFTKFSVSTPQNGTYVCHVVNWLSTSNVTATLFISRDFSYEIQDSMPIQDSITVNVQRAQPFPWTEMKQIVITVLDASQKIGELYKQIKPQENLFPLTDPNELIYIVMGVFSTAILTVFLVETKRKHFKEKMISENFERLGLLRETRKTKKERRVGYKAI
jgi:hypothetical protein